MICEQSVESLTHLIRQCVHILLLIRTERYELGPNRYSLFLFTSLITYNIHIGEIIFSSLKETLGVSPFKCTSQLNKILEFVKILFLLLSTILHIGHLLKFNSANPQLKPRRMSSSSLARVIGDFGHLRMLENIRITSLITLAYTSQHVFGNNNNRFLAVSQLTLNHKTHFLYR